MLVDLTSESFFPGPVYSGYGREIAESRYLPAAFSTVLGAKDLRLARAAAAQVGLDLPTAPVLEEIFRTAIDMGLGEHDWAAIAQVTRSRVTTPPTPVPHRTGGLNMTTPQQQWQDLQEQNLELLKSQQEAYLAGIKAWQTQLAATTEAASTNTTTGSVVPAVRRSRRSRQYPAGPDTGGVPGISHHRGDHRDQPRVPGRRSPNSSRNSCGGSRP